MKVTDLLKFDQNLKCDAGYLNIFHEIGYIGDSLSSGEFVYDHNGGKGHWDAYDFSWGKIIERNSGIKCTNYSSGGLTAKDVYTQADTHRATWHEVNHLFEPTHIKPAYFIALGLNDINNYNRFNAGTRDHKDYEKDLGNAKDDVCINDLTKCSDSFAGWYGKIILRIAKIQPNTKFFLIGIPNDHCFPNIEKANAVIKELSELIPNCYYIDLFNDAPDYDEAFYDRFFESDHMNAMGYAFTAKLIQTLADKLIWENFKDFKTVQFIGTELKPLITSQSHK